MAVQRLYTAGRRALLGEPEPARSMFQIGQALFYGKPVTAAELEFAGSVLVFFSQFPDVPEKDVLAARARRIGPDGGRARGKQKQDAADEEWRREFRIFAGIEQRGGRGSRFASALEDATPRARAKAATRVPVMERRAGLSNIDLAKEFRKERAVAGRDAPPLNTVRQYAGEVRPKNTRRS